ncbi:hypothetical protein ACFX12_030125 [Malus domestica]
MRPSQRSPPLDRSSPSCMSPLDVTPPPTQARTQQALPSAPTVTDCISFSINGVHMTLRRMTRAAHSNFDGGHKFQNHRRPSIASSSMKSMAEIRSGFSKSPMAGP